MNQKEFGKRGVNLIFIIFLPLVMIISMAIILYIPEEFSQKTSAISNIIGSVSAFVTIIFGYTVLTSQNDFSKKQELSQQTNSIDTFISETVDLINDMEWNEKKGIGAIREFKWDINIVHTFYDELNSILIRFKDIGQLIEKVEDVEIKEIYKKRLFTLFYSKVLWNLNKSFFEGENFQAKALISKHDDSPIIIENYIKLTNECIGYLLTNKLISNSDSKRQLILKLNLFLEENKLRIESSKT